MSAQEVLKKLREIEKECTDTELGTVDYDEFARKVFEFMGELGKQLEN